MHLLFVAALSAALPHPADLKTFGDWIVGCDNARACEARALLPADMEAGWSVMELRRGAAAGALAQFTIVGVDPVGHADLTAGPLKVSVVVGQDGSVQTSPAFTPAILAAAHREPALLVKADGKTVSRVSLKGALAAMLWIDEKQRRVGTTTALLRSGPRPASDVPAQPPLPTLVIPALRSAKPPARLTAAALREIIGDNACKKDASRSDEPPTYDRLDARHTLALVPLVCISGAYNIQIDAQVIDDGAPKEPQPAVYEKVFADQKDGGDITNENTSWDAKRRRLSVSMKGRSFGDCGTRREYAWDGRRFRFVYEEDMGECRGAAEYIPTWRAMVLER